MTEILTREFPPLCRHIMRCTIYFLLIISGVPTLALGVSVEKIKLDQKVQPSSASVYDHFGTSVAISGDIMAVGSPQHDSFWEDSGALYVYIKINDDWQFLRKLQAKPTRENGLFG